MTTLHIRQDAPNESQYSIRLTLKRAGQPDMEAEAKIEFALTGQEQKDLRWYLEDYLEHAETIEAIAVEQVETLMKTRGEQYQHPFYWAGFSLVGDPRSNGTNSYRAMPDVSSNMLAGD